MRVLLVFLSLFVLTAAAGAANPRNAATWYRRSIEALDRVGVEDRNYLGDVASGTDQVPVITPRLRAVVSRGRDAIRFAERGAAQDFCDFELDYGEGWSLQLPHLSQLRFVARLMRAEAFIAMHDGKARRAADLLAAIYRMGEHLECDRILISSLVGTAIFRLADAGVRHAMDRAAFGPGEARRLADALPPADDRDPFGFRVAVGNERAMTVGWLESKREEGELENMVAALTGSDEQTEAVSGMTEAELEADLGRYDEVMGRVETAFALDDDAAAEEALEALGGEIEAGDHGVIAMMAVPALMKIHEFMTKAQAMVDERRRAMEALASGAMDRDDQANAVVAYMAAIERLRESPDRAALRGLDPDAAPDDASRALLDRLGPVLELVREGASRRRCDWNYVRWTREPLLVQPWTAGMRDLFRLVHAELRRAIAAGDDVGALDHAVTAHRVSAHLGLAETVPAAIVAHRGLIETERLLDGPRAAGRLSGAAARERLREALETIPRTDPFGYAKAREQVLGAVASRIAFGLIDAETTPAPELSARQQWIFPACGAWSTERLLAAHAAFEHGRPPEDDRPAVELDGLEDVVDAEALAALRERAVAALAELGAATEAEALDAVALPEPIRVAPWMSRAPGDLRRALREADERPVSE